MTDRTPLVREMLRIRMVEEAIAREYPKGEMRCPVHLSIGQEAVAVGAAAALARSDLAVSTHRAHAHYLAKGGNLRRMLAELFGKATGCSAGRGGSMHLIDLEAGFEGSTAIVGNTIPVGVGLALGSAVLGDSVVTCVFLGDGATEEGVFYESANLAVVRRLPVLFVCENNLYSVYSPLAVRQPPRRRIFEVAQAIGLAAQAHEGNDVFAVAAAAAGAVDGIRRGGGPAFLEFSTYRWLEHCGPNNDDALGYRSGEEIADWRRRDPLEMAVAALRADPTFSDATLGTWRADIAAEIAAAFEFARSSPWPDASTAADFVYA